jgi:hypothetical protein
MNGALQQCSPQTGSFAVCMLSQAAQTLRAVVMCKAQQSGARTAAWLSGHAGRNEYYRFGNDVTAYPQEKHTVL